MQNVQKVTFLGPERGTYEQSRHHEVMTHLCSSVHPGITLIALSAQSVEQGRLDQCARLYSRVEDSRDDNFNSFE